jgi:hypothetical protein
MLSTLDERPFGLGAWTATGSKATGWNGSGCG